jgi:hypothetical protein
MKTVKKTPVKKYTKGGPKTSMLDKKIQKTSAKATALREQAKADAPKGMGSTWAGMSSKQQKLDDKVKKLAARSIKKTYTSPTKAANKTTAKELEDFGKKRGGSVSKMKRGGTAKRK